jgi:tetratricopeptide (TPR) repeat protein
VLLLLALFCSIGCKKNPAILAEQDYTRAHEYLAQNKPEAAIIELLRAVQLQPDMAKAHHDLAKLYFDRGDALDSVREYSLAIRYNPEDREGCYAVGDILLAMREFSKAKDLAMQISSRWPEDRRAKQLLAESTMGLGDWVKARGLVEENVKADPKEARAQFDLATSLIHDKKWLEAEQTLRVSWSLDSKAILTPLVLAQLLESQGNRKDAEGVLKQAAAEHADRAEPLFALANLYIRARRLTDAEETFKKIQMVDGKNPASRVSLAAFYAATGRPGDAEKELQRIVAEYPEDALAWRQLVEVEITVNRRDEARRIATQLLKKDAKDWQALTLLGRLDLEEGKAAEAEQELGLAQNVNPDSPLIYFQLARLRVSQGKPDLAKQALEESLKRGPDDVAARVLLGSLELRTGQTGLAVVDLSKALRQAPAATEPNLMISQAYALRGQFNLAEVTLNWLLSQPSTSETQAMILQTLAEVRFRQARYAEAGVLATKSLNTGVLSSEALRVLGLSYLAEKHPEQGLKAVEGVANRKEHWAAGQDVVGGIALLADQIDVAEKAYRNELESSPNSSSALFGLGNVYERRQEYDRAADYFHRFATAEPNNAAVHVRLGIIAEHSQDWQKAISEYQNADKLDSANVVAKNNLAWLYAAHGGDLAVALRLAEEARGLQPGDPIVADTLGWILVKMNLAQDALPYLKESVAKKPDQAVYHYHLGMAYLKTGKEFEAKNELSAALQYGKPFDGFDDAKQALAGISKTR